MFLFTFAGSQLLRHVKVIFRFHVFSSSPSSCSCSTERAFVQLDPLHWLQTGEHSKLRLWYEHHMVDLQSHITISRRLSSAAWWQVHHNRNYLTVFYPLSQLFYINLFPSPIKDLGVHTETVELCCSFCWREPFSIYLGSVCCQLFMVALISETSWGFVLSCRWIGAQVHFPLKGWPLLSLQCPETLPHAVAIDMMS